MDLLSSLCPRDACRSGEPTASLDGNADETGHSAEQGHGQGQGQGQGQATSGRRDVELANGGQREGYGKSNEG